MIYLKKKLAILILIAGGIFATGCAAVGGGGDNAALGDLLTERQVIRALYDEPDLTGEPIIVSCVDGIITLSGTVESAIEKQLAERVASGVSGVTRVNNNLQFDS